MLGLRDTSIQRKLVWIVMLSTTVALVLGSSGFMVSEFTRTRKDMVETLSSVADIVGRSCTVALDFDVQKDAHDILAGLDAQPHIVSAVLYDRKGQVFATFKHPRRPGPLFPKEPPPPGHRFRESHLELCRPVLANGEQVGTLFLKSDLTALSSRIQFDALILVALLAVSLAAAFLVSARLQRLISGPIVNLSQTVRNVAAQKDYAVRVPSQSRDEIGQLIGSFNEMLAQIQARDAALHEARDSLEKRVEERTRELAESLSILRATLDSAADGIVVINARGKIVNCNRKFATMWGIPEAMLAGRQDRRIRPHMLAQLKEPGRFVDALRQLHADCEATRLDAVEFRDGRVFEWYSQNQKTEDARAGRVLSFRDITRQQHVEAELARARDSALESARLKSEFLANMSHEIRSPMNGVIGMTDLLLGTDLQPAQRRYAQTIRVSGEALLAIINDILDFSKIEAKKLTIEAVEFDLREVVEGTLVLLSENARAKHVELAACIAPDVVAWRRGDPGRLRQVLTNLIGNAIKFTDHGDVVVRVTECHAPDGPACLRFEVQDTGIGIAPEAQGRLFQAFSQADGSTTRKYGGTGLGLAICKHLVEMMGGQIGVVSQQGRGSLFWFTTRLEKQAVPQAAKPDRQPLPDGLHVLIVDDNAAHRQVLEYHTRLWRMRGQVATHASEALALLRGAGADRFDLAILDMSMPEMDRLQLALAIKADPATANTRLIVLTALGEGPSEAALREAGVDAWLSKPIRQSQLFDSMAIALGQASLIESQPATSPSRAVHAPLPLRILLVEDNPINQEVALEQLHRLGCGADVATNGLEALDAVERRPYDILLMDCQMPEMDGYQATRELRKRERNQARKPVHIIAMTAHAMAGDREKCLAAGMNDYVTKPVREIELREALERGCPDLVRKANAPVSSPASQEPVPPSPVLASVPADGEPEPLDLARLNEVTGGDQNRARKLLAMYLEQAQQVLDAMGVAIQGGAVAEVARLAHKLAGSSSSIGMTRIVPPLRALERMDKTGELSEAPAWLAQTQREVETIRQFLAGHLGESSGKGSSPPNT